MKNKGFLFSVLTLLIFLSIVMLAISMRGMTQKTSIGQQKTRGLHDDLESNYKKLAGLQIDVNDTGSDMVITFNDTMPFQNGSQIMADYKNFVEQKLAKELNTNISVNVSSSDFIVNP